MAIQDVQSAVDVYWVDSKDIINDNFDELDERSDDITSSEAEINLLDGVANSFTTTATPASGTCGVQFVFKQADGTTSITTPFSGFGYICTASDGLTTKSVTSIAALTNGRVLNVPTITSLFHFTTTAAGLLGITITASAGDYYVAFILPNGKIAVSSVCTVS